MSRARSNWSVIPAAPRKLTDVISVTPAMRPNWRSSGVATAEAMVSGLAPGRPAKTVIVGKSTCGSGATGRTRNAITPAMTSAIVMRVVPTGRRTNGVERLTARSPAGRGAPARAPAGEARRQAVEREIDDRRGVEREDLAHDQPAHDRDAERLAKLGAHAVPERERHAAEQRRHRGHDDRPKAQERGLLDRLA